MSLRHLVQQKTHRIPYLHRSFYESDLYLAALLWKMMCNLGDPMSLGHPVTDIALGQLLHEDNYYIRTTASSQTLSLHMSVLTPSLHIIGLFCKRTL